MDSNEESNTDESDEEAEVQKRLAEQRVNATTDKRVRKSR